MLTDKNVVANRVSELPQSTKFEKYCTIMILCNRCHKVTPIMAPIADSIRLNNSK